MVHLNLATIRNGLTLAVLCASSAMAAEQSNADRQDAAQAYMQCVHNNGYTEFPAPDEQGGFQFVIERGDVQRFRSAAEACQHLIPEDMRDGKVTAEQMEELLKLSQCARDNGLPGFPDPDVNGSFDLRGISGGPDDPKINATIDACRDEAGGVPIMIGG